MIQNRSFLVDCWDGTDDEPMIYHGWTLTSKILFKDVVEEAIKPYAFFRSEYPLILSIENHCSVKQQDKMAAHLKDILGDMLYSGPPDPNRKELPSPQSLVGKVLIKAPKTPNDDWESVEDLEDVKKPKKPKKISEKLSQLVNYIEPVHFQHFNQAESKYYHMSSFGEAKAVQLMKNEETARDFVKYNCRQISRIYPGAKRTDSSNLKVIQPWNTGCQMGNRFI